MDKEAVSEALEQRYVHDVYDRIAPHCCRTHHKAWPHVQRFLEDLKPGCLVADIGCGNGRYLGINHNIFTLGSDRCSVFTTLAADQGREVMVCDNLNLPYRNEAFDAVISICVIHHFTTIDRRIEAVRELTRILRCGGRVMICVWAMEQTRRNFDAQDVLVPWNKDDKKKRKRARSKARLQNTSSSSFSEDDNLSDSVPVETVATDDRQVHKTSIRHLFEKIADLVEKAQNLDNDDRSSKFSAKNSESQTNGKTIESPSYLTKSPVLPAVKSPVVASDVIIHKKGKCKCGVCLSQEKIERRSLPDIFRDNFYHFLSSKFTSGHKASSQESILDKDSHYQNLLNCIIKNETHLFGHDISTAHDPLASEDDSDLVFQVREFPQSSQPRRKLMSDSALNSTASSVFSADSLQHSSKHILPIRAYSADANISVDNQFSSISITDDDSDSLFSNSKLDFGEIPTSSPLSVKKPFSLNLQSCIPSNLQNCHSVAASQLSNESGKQSWSFPELSHDCEDKSNVHDSLEGNQQSLSDRNNQLLLPPRSSRLGSDEFSSSSSDVHSGSTPGSQHDDLKTAFSNNVDRAEPKNTSQVSDKRLVYEISHDDGMDIKSPTYHRYYHVFREGELSSLIEKHVPGLEVLEAYYDHTNWCVIAEKVDCWNT